MTRTGQEYLESLRDGRAVWLDGELVKDITEHPAFRNTARSIARLYDLAHKPELRDTLTVPSGESGGPDDRILRAYRQPTSHAELVERRRAFKTWAEAGFGFLGRSPGHPAEQRIKLFKLAWDALGSEFAGRHEQYERFYHRAPHVYLPGIVRNGSPEALEALTRSCLDGYDLHDEPALTPGGVHGPA
ncbi:4-hydroxyphenylacetate 3-hydroxylase N-terminal domain-containing protein [Streptomyces sp. KL2]|uniref:4-hydroxyphenylacetate 3-hydroxylase N-terminal domain-containing protein n=1 Tax=Streptomyces sp. KL2 TaxID=3050126 RepID=UPI00397DD1BE